MPSVDVFTTIINQLLPEPHAGLLNGMLFGIKATMSRELTDALITTGTLHIVALSGMNITILTSLVNATLLWAVSRRIASLLTVGIIIGFILFVGPSPSIVRAGIMGSITMIAISLGRQRWSLYAWAVACGSMLLVQPRLLFDLSFQLSALATLGIILFANEKVEGRLLNGEHEQSTVLSLPSTLNPLLSALRADLRVTLAAQVFTIPLIFFAFHRISLVSPLTNVLIGFIIPPLTAIGMVTVLLGWIWLPLGYIGSWVCWLMLSYILAVVDWTSRIPFASVGW